VKLSADRVRLSSTWFVLLMALSSVIYAQTASSSSASDPPTSRPELLESLGVRGVIDIEADGSVSQVVFNQSSLKQEIELRLKNMLQAWRFRPIEVDGNARNIRSSFLLRLDLLRDPDKLWLQVAKYEFGVPVQLNTIPPRYPTSALRDRVGAEMLMWVSVRADGSVAEVEPVRGQVFGKRIRSENAHQNALKPFVQSAITAIGQWRYGYFTPSSDGGLTQLLVPIRYSLTPNRQLGEGAPMPLLFDAATRLSTPLADLLSPENRLSDDPDAPISLESESRIQPLEESIESTVVL
jgi:hypothetical protein